MSNPLKITKEGFFCYNRTNPFFIVHEDDPEYITEFKPSDYTKKWLYRRKDDLKWSFWPWNTLDIKGFRLVETGRDFKERELEEFL